jgi:hypothetical protein
MIHSVGDQKINGYDIIGDVHGHAGLLQKLLISLGYIRGQSGFSHPDKRQAVFVGDLINRGPDTTGTLKIVRDMHLHGNAQVTLGNHEWRLIQEVVKNGYPENKALEPFIPWIRSWPLFLDFPTFRVVHAAWHFSSIALLENKHGNDDQFIHKTLQKGSDYQKAVQRILYGLKVRLPKEIEMKDRFGMARTKGRIQWWKDPQGQSFADYLLSPMYPAPSDRYPAPDEVRDVEPYSFPEKPVFTGHYCVPPNIPKVNEQVVCVDGCVTCDKKLWAYSFNHEAKPERQNLVSISENH